MNFFQRIKSVLSNTAGKSGIFTTFVSLLYPLTRFDPKKYYTMWVFAAINAIAEQTSTLEIKLQKKNSKKEWEDISDHPALTLLKKVNPEMTSSQLFYSVPAWCESEGNAFWIIFYSAAGQPIELWPFDPTKVTIHTDDMGMVDGYYVTNERGQRRWLEKYEIIHFKRYNIKDRLRGIGTIEAVRLEVETDINSSEYNRNFFANDATPGATLETEKSLTQEQITQLKKQWESNHRGSENAHKMAILHSGLSFKPSSVNHHDMQFFEQKKYSRDSIIAIFRVPPVLLGIIEDANRANIEGAEYIFAKHRVKPYMNFIVDHLNEFYLPLWKLNPDEYRFALAFDPVPANEELILKKKQTSYGKWVTANEIRAEEGREPIEGGDTLADPNRVSVSQPEEATPQKSKKKILTKKKDDPVVKGLKTLLAENLDTSTQKYQTFLNNTKDDLLKKLKDQKTALKTNIKRKDFSSPVLYLMKLKALQKANGEELAKLLFEDWDKWVGVLYDSLKDDDELAMEHGGRIAMERVGVTGKFDIENDRAQAWIEDTSLKNAKSIVGTLKDDLRVVVLDAVKAGEGAQGVANVLEEQYSQLEDWKALQIARSELCTAYSQGSLEGYRQSDVVEKKEWFTGGSNPCETCLGNEAQGAIALDDNFQSGDDAPTAHPNDECTLLPVIKKD